MSTPPLSPELIARLAPYAALLGELTDAQIAEQLDLDPETVAAFRTAQAQESTREETVNEETSPAEEEAPDPQPAPEAAPTADSSEPATDPSDAEETAWAAREAEAEACWTVLQERFRAARELLDTYVQSGALPAAGTLAAAVDATLVPGGGPASAPTGKETGKETRHERATGEAAPVSSMQAAAGRAPNSVRVVKRGQVEGPNGRPLRLSRFDVHSGELAAWLWTHHRGHVEPYLPRR